MTLVPGFTYYLNKLIFGRINPFKSGTSFDGSVPIFPACYTAWSNSHLLTLYLTFTWKLLIKTINKSRV